MMFWNNFVVGQRRMQVELEIVSAFLIFHTKWNVIYKRQTVGQRKRKLLRNFPTPNTRILGNNKLNNREDSHA